MSPAAATSRARAARRQDLGQEVFEILERESLALSFRRRRRLRDIERDREEKKATVHLSQTSRVSVVSRSISVACIFLRASITRGSATIMLFCCHCECGDEVAELSQMLNFMGSDSDVQLMYGFCVG